MLTIARSVLADRQDLAALLFTCSPQVEALPVPPGLDYIKLPSARKVRHLDYVPRTLAVDPASLRRLRSSLLLDGVRSYRPDLMLVDKSPVGLMGELRPTLELLRNDAPNTRLVLGWRDVLDEPRAILQEWKRTGARDALEHYDEIWIYGDPAVFDAREAYALPARLAERVRYLGYLVKPVDSVETQALRERLSPDGAPVALVTVGGGEDGEALLGCYLEALRRGLLPRDLRSFIVTGPFMPAEAQRRLRAAVSSERVTVASYLSGLESAIGAADVVVSMTGYNTVCEILSAGTPAVLVPRVRPRHEQRIRAQQLARFAQFEHVDAELLDPEHLAAATVRGLQRDRQTTPLVRCDGLQQVVCQMRRLLPSHGHTNGVAATSRANCPPGVREAKR